MAKVLVTGNRNEMSIQIECPNLLERVLFCVDFLHLLLGRTTITVKKKSVEVDC